MTDHTLPPELAREAAVTRIRRAKELMTRAARASMDAHPLAPALGDAAKEELDAAMAELRAIDAQGSDDR